MIVLPWVLRTVVLPFDFFQPFLSGLDCGFYETLIFCIFVSLYLISNGSCQSNASYVLYSLILIPDLGGSMAIGIGGGS